jgi:hypothetical protein
MGKRSPAPPPAPDYTALAQAQGAANVDAARATARLSNPNISGPLGGQTVSYGGYNDAAFRQALANYEQNKDWYRSQGYEMPKPDPSQFVSSPDTPMVSQYLTPEAQKTLDAQQRVQLALAGLGEQEISTAQRIMGTPFQYTGPAIRTSLAGAGEVPQGEIAIPKVGTGLPVPQLQTTLRDVGQVAYGPSESPELTRNVAGPTLQTSLDTSKLAAMPINAGTTAQEALMSRLQPQLERQRSQLETQLANQGLVRGGEAYNAAIQEQAQRENDLRTQAALQGINLDLQARQQGLGELQSLGMFGNQAQLAQFGAGLQGAQFTNQALQNMFANRQAIAEARNRAQQQAFGQELQAGQFGNQAQLAAYDAALRNRQNELAAQQQAMQQAMANRQLAMSAQNQAYNQALQSGQFENTAAQQAMQQQLGLYNQPLNQISALMSGSQIQMPQFQGYQGANVGAAPVFQAGQAQNQYNMDVYNQQMAGRNALTGGLFGLGASALGNPGLFG